MIPAIVFLSGAVVMSFEMLGSRILAPHFGNTVFVWGGLISVFLSGLTVGYWGGGRLADRIADLRCFAALLAIPGVILCCFPLYCDVVNIWIYDQGFGVRMEPMLASLILFFPPTAFMGAVSPYAVKLQVKNLRWLGTGVGNLYALSSLGSILGTLLTSFYLIVWIGVRWIIVAEGILLLATACAVWIFDILRYRRQRETFL
ncbi:MAG: fused MFS/spermidine synthase [Candidatus Omnitrophota bacterium]